MVHPPLAFHIVLGLVQQLPRNRRIAPRQHRKPLLVVAVFLQRDGRCFGVELERILALLPQRRVVPHQRPVSRKHRVLLLLHAVRQIEPMGDAMAIRNDQCRTVVSLCLLERLDCLRIIAAHRDACHIHRPIADSLHRKILLAIGLPSRSELRDSATRCRLGHLTAGVGVRLGIEHQHLHVLARAKHMVQSAKANVIRPAIATHQPDALAHQRVRHQQQRASLW